MGLLEKRTAAISSPVMSPSSAAPLEIRSPYLSYVQPSLDCTDRVAVKQAVQARADLLQPFLEQLNSFGDRVRRVQLVRDPSLPHSPLCIINTSDDGDVDRIQLNGMAVLLLPPNHRLPLPPSSSSPLLLHHDTPVDWDSHSRMLPAYHKLVERVVNHHSNVVCTSITSSCLVVGVTRKGYIPWGESELPKHVDNHRVRVIERRCRHAVGDDEYRTRMDVIKPGATIAVEGTNNIGTIGAYLPSPPSPRFLTCCHVVHPSSCSAHGITAGFDIKPITQPTSQRWKRDCERTAPSFFRMFSSPPTIVAGEARSVRYGNHPVQIDGLSLNIGIDAALCKASELRAWSTNPEIEHPTRGRLIVDPRPISMSQDFRLLCHPQSLVVKRGAITGVRFGRVQFVGSLVDGSASNGVDVLHDSTSHKCHCPKGVSEPLLHQIEIAGVAQEDVQGAFAERGDSGAIVFLLPFNERNRIRPLALLHAIDEMTSFAYATPIEVVQQALGIDTFTFV